jgi:trigger factor
MEVQMEKLSQPFLFSTTIEADDLLQRKEKAFDKVKDDLQLVGFRKGKVPRKVAEDMIGVEKLYRPILDDIYFDIADKYDVVSSAGFTIYGDFKDGNPLKIEFIGEIKPKTELPELNDLEISFDKDTVVSEEEIKTEIDDIRKKGQKEEPADHEDLRNLDVAIIDFNGYLEGDSIAFKGGSAKDYKLEVNKEMNGRKQFIDNFEDQIVGMKKNEIREVNVTFPAEYRDTTKAGKKAKFIVTLKDIKKYVLPEVNVEFIKQIFKNVDEASPFTSFNNFIKERIAARKQKQKVDDLKQTIIQKLIEKTTFSPIPLGMIEQELEKEWRSYLYRMGTTEQEHLQKHADGKNQFRAASRDNSIVLIKMSLIYEEFAKKNDVTATDDEVKDYYSRISRGGESKLDKLENPKFFKTVKQAYINDKVTSLMLNCFLK